MTKKERAFADRLFLIFLLCQVSNGVDLSWDNCQMEWDKRHKTEKFIKYSFLGWLLKFLTNLVDLPDQN